MAEEKYVAISGGFVVLHKGHIRLINEAADYGKVVVILNTDEWVKRKYGYVVADWAARAEVLLALRNVYNVIIATDDDGTVCKTLQHMKPHYFANGGDRTEENTPEQEICKQLGIEMLWGVGGKKTGSSSGILNAAR